jgi:hypothetical protein
MKRCDEKVVASTALSCKKMNLRCIVFPIRDVRLKSYYKKKQRRPPSKKKEKRKKLKPE